MPTTKRFRPGSAGEVLQRRCEDLVAIEMTRLGRRVPTLNSVHRMQAHEALGRFVHELVLSRAHAVRDEELALVFDVTGTP